MSLYTEEIGFAAGTMIATLSNPVSGLVTPIKFGILQDVDLSFTADLKELYGQYRYAVALAPGKTKVELKAKFAAVRGNLFNSTYFGTLAASGVTRFADSEQHTVPGSSAYTVSANSAAAFGADQGVVYQNTGQPLSVVSAFTAAGQYEVTSGGVYTFGSNDANAVVALNYTYTVSGGNQITIQNPKMGVGPVFSVMLDQAFDGREQTFIFPLCQASKLQFPTKQDDFTILELDFMVAANAAGIVGYISTSN